MESRVVVSNQTEVGVGGFRESSLEQVIPELHFKISIKVNPRKRARAKGE